MRKALIAFFMIGCLAATTRQASAGDFLAEACWNKTGSPGFVKMSVSSGGSQFELHGIQTTTDVIVIEDGLFPILFPVTRHLPLTGNATVIGADIVVGLMYTHDGSGFEGCRALSETVFLNPATLNGTGNIDGVGCDFEATSTTWTRTSCSVD